MGTFVLGLFLLLVGIIATITSVIGSMSGGVDLYNNLSYMYNALRWSQIGIVLMVLGGTLTIIGYIKRKH